MIIFGLMSCAIGWLYLLTDQDLAWVIWQWMFTILWIWSVFGKWSR